MTRTGNPTRPTLRDVIDPNSFPLRQELIRRIQSKLGGKLITYVANPNHPAAIIHIQDAMQVEDLLRSVSDSKKGYLMITSPGGDPNAAEKLIVMCRERFPEGFNVIVPNYAKSAATLIALGADKILMGYSAELGPVDPQIGDPISGQSVPARAVIDGLETIRKKVKEGDSPLMYIGTLSRVQPELISICQSAIDESKATAEKWLTNGMLRHNPAHAKEVAKWLSTGETYKSHGKVIDCREAKEVLKLNIEKIDPNSELWDDLWELYVRQMTFFQNPAAAMNIAKLFESETVSLTMSISIQVLGIPRQPIQPPPQIPIIPIPKAPPQAPPKVERPVQA